MEAAPGDRRRAERPPRAGRCWSTTSTCARSPTASSSASSTPCAPRASSAARRPTRPATRSSATASAPRCEPVRIPAHPDDRDGGADLHPDPARRPPARLPVADRGPRRSTTSELELARARRRRGRGRPAVRGRHPARPPPPRAGADRRAAVARRGRRGRRRGRPRGRPLPPAAPADRLRRRAGGAAPDAIDRFRARVPAKHALCGEVGGRRDVRRRRAGADARRAARRGAAQRRARGRRVHVGEGDAVGRAARRPRLPPPRARGAAGGRRPRRGGRPLGRPARPPAADRAPADRARRPPGRPAQAARRRPRAARADARDLPRSRRRRQEHGGGAVAAPHEPLLPPAPDRGGRGRGPQPRRGPAALPRRAAAVAASAQRVA